MAPDLGRLEEPYRIALGVSWISKLREESIERLSPGWNQLLPSTGTVLRCESALAYLVVASSVRYRAKLLGDSIAHRVGFAVFNVDGTDEQVVRDVIQVPTELEPRTSGRNVVCGALAFDLGW